MIVGAVRVKIGSEKIWDSIVFGAGTSGMVAGSMLSGRFEGRASENASVLILDEYPKIGGNHINVDIGRYTFDIGSFFFSENSRFFKHFPELIPLYENRDPGTYSTARITPDLKIGRYPFDFKLDVWGHGPLMPLRYVASALYGRMFFNENCSAEDFARHWIGDRFFQKSGLKHYMIRLFGEDPSRIESEFAHKRMRWIKKNAQAREVIRSVLRRIRNQAPVPIVPQLVRPKEGYQELYGTVKKTLQTHGVEIRLSVELENVKGSSETGFEVSLADGAKLRCHRLISTIPLSRSLPLCGLEAPTQLRTASLISLFVSFSGRREFQSNVLYNFSTDGQWKRLTMHSDFYGKENGREYFSVECIPEDINDPPEKQFAEFKSLVKKIGIFDGELVLEGYRTTKNAYPIFLQGATRAADLARKQLREFGVLSFGRQGGFDYQPTAGVSSVEVERHLAPNGLSGER